MPRFDSNISTQRWESCKSLVTGEAIPPFAVVEVVDAEIASELGSVSDEPLLRVRKPTSAVANSGGSAPEEYYGTRGHRLRFNGPVEIPAGGFGYVTRDVPTHVLCHSILGGDPAIIENDLFAPVSGQWYLGEVSIIASDDPVVDLVQLFNLALISDLVTNETGCVVGYVTAQSRSRT